MGRVKLAALKQGTATEANVKQGVDPANALGRVDPLNIVQQQDATQKFETAGSVILTASNYMDALFESEGAELPKPGDIINPESLEQEIVTIYEGLEAKGLFRKAEIAWHFIHGDTKTLPRDIRKVEFENEIYDGYGIHISRLSQLNYVTTKQLDDYAVLSTKASVLFENALRAHISLSPEAILDKQYQRHVAVFAVLDTLELLKEYIKTEGGRNGHLRETILNIISAYSVLASLITEDETGVQTI